MEKSKEGRREEEKEGRRGVAVRVSVSLSVYVFVCAGSLCVSLIKGERSERTLPGIQHF